MASRCCRGGWMLILAAATSALAGCGERPVDLRDRLVLQALEPVAYKFKVDNHGRVIELNLDYQRLDDGVLEAVLALDRLRVLNLNRTDLDDRGLDRLTALTKLQTLRLRETYVTDAGLAHLARLADLRVLAVTNWKAISNEQIASLKKALPGLKVYR